jgi:hypothetical protein
MNHPLNDQLVIYIPFSSVLQTRVAIAMRPSGFSLRLENGVFSGLKFIARGLRRRFTIDPAPE